MIAGTNISRQLKRGFTLMELLLVLMIMGVILGFMIPRMEPTPGLRLDAEYQQIDALAQVVRTKAVASGVPGRIAFVTSCDDTEFDHSSIFSLEPFEDENVTKWRVASRPKFLDNGVFFDPASSSGLPETSFTWNDKTLNALVVEFLPNGLCSQEGAQLMLAIGYRNDSSIDLNQNEGYHFELLFTRLGKVVPASTRSSHEEKRKRIYHH
jgi:prepilin-type N-terminal cleavage/methylation domain-containing protein